MKPINAFSPSHISDDWWQHIVISKGGGDTPVTILPGHLAESLRWRKVGEEEPELQDYHVMRFNELKLFVVQIGLTTGLYVAFADELSDGSHKLRWINEDGEDRDIYDYHLYRPAIPGIDYVEGEV